MSHKSVLAVLVGVAIVIAGALIYFLRSPMVRESNSAIFGLIAFAVIGCSIMVAVILYHREPGERFFLSGVSIIVLTVPLTMLSFYVSAHKWYWAIGPLATATICAGVFLTAHGVAKSRPVKLVLLDNFAPYCPKCQRIFPLASKGDDCKNGCTP